MGWVSFAGNVLLAYGPACSVFFSIVTARPQLFIIFLFGAFFSMLAALLASMCWSLLSLMFDAAWLWTLLLVAAQEVSRTLFFRAYVRAEHFWAYSENIGVVYPLNDLMSSVAGGLGFGVSQATMVYGATIFASLGPGTVYSETCPQIPAFTVAAIVSGLFSLSHLVWMTIAFDGLRRKSLWRVSSVCIANAAAGILVAMQSTQLGCVLPLTLQGAVLLLSFSLAWYVVHRPAYRMKLRSL